MKEEKKYLSRPEAEIISLEGADIITASEKIPDIENTQIVNTDKYKFTISE